MRVLIVEDEKRIAKRIMRMTADYLRHTPHEILTAEDLDEAEEVFAQEKIDLVLLDLNLNGESGFELLKPLVAEAFDTIIISANHDMALKAFEFGVLDFVPKPFSRERLEKAFNRLSTLESTTEVSFLAVKKKGGLKVIRLEDISYIQGADIYSKLVLRDGNTELHNKPLEKLEHLLFPQYERIHRSYLVPFHEIKEILVMPGSIYRVVLYDGTIIPIGRSRYKKLRKRLDHLE